MPSDIVKWKKYLTDDAGTELVLEAMAALGQGSTRLTSLGELGRYLFTTPEQLHAMVNELRILTIVSGVPVDDDTVVSVDDSHWLLPDPGSNDLWAVELRRG